MAQKTDTATKAEKVQTKKVAPKQSTVKPIVAKTKKTKATTPEVKKSHKGLVAVVILVVVLLLGLIGAGVYFCWYNNPSKVAYDAFNNLVKAENVALEGTVTLHSRDKNSSVQDVIVEFTSATNSIPNATSAKVTVVLRSEQDGDTTGKISISVRNVIMKDGAIYLQISGIMDSIESFGIDEDTRDELGIYFDTIEIIDNEWWRIYIPEILEEMNLSLSQNNVVNDMYDCFVEAADRDYSDEISTVYKQNRFINIERTTYLEPETVSTHAKIASGYHAYRLSVDKTQLAEFLNRMVEGEAVGDAIACYNQVAKKYDGDTVDVSDIDELSAEDIRLPEDIYVGLEISDFDHRLRSIQIQPTSDNDSSYQYTVSLMFNYVDMVVEAPDSYRPISDLVEEIVELFVSVIEEE